VQPRERSGLLIANTAPPRTRFYRSEGRRSRQRESVVLCDCLTSAQCQLLSVISNEALLASSAVVLRCSIALLVWVNAVMCADLAACARAVAGATGLGENQWSRVVRSELDLNQRRLVVDGTKLVVTSVRCGYQDYGTTMICECDVGCCIDVA
jgi:hypothetical protein